MVTAKKGAIVTTLSALIVSNALIALRHVGIRAGQEYQWVCRESGAVLSYNPAIFGSARVSGRVADAARDFEWELIEPKSLSPYLPWNWLAIVMSTRAPDPREVWRTRPDAL